MEHKPDHDLEFTGNLWSQLFQEDRTPNEEETFLESRLRINPTDDHLLAFLRDYAENTAEEEVITAFCADYHLSALTNPSTVLPRRAWLDDRQWHCVSTSSEPGSQATEETKCVNSVTRGPSFPKEITIDMISNDVVDERRPTSLPPQNHKRDSPFREYKFPLDAYQLLQHLKQKRFAHETLPDADRRLIYVSGLNPGFVHALIETATQHQAASLKTALYMHIAGKTDMGVRISYKKFEIFELYFYTPFPVLCAIGDDSLQLDDPTGSFRPTFLNIASIVGSTLQPSDEGSSVLQVRHIAIHICGVANHRWIGYAFVDGDEGMDEEEGDYTAMIQDQFAANGDVDANRPIWDPREYFLLIILIRVDQIIRAWTWLIQRIETSHQKDILGLGSDDTESEDAATIFRRTQGAVKTIGFLHDILSETNDCWADFSARDGHIAYFEHTDGLSAASRTQVKRCLLDFKNKTRRLRITQRRLEAIERRCQRAVDSLERRLAVESNTAAKASGAHANLMVAWISPVAVVSAFFSIPAPFGNFPRTGTSFTIAMLIVTVALQLLIYVQHKPWRMQKVWFRGSYRKGTPQAIVSNDRHNEGQQRQTQRVDTAQTLVDSPV